MTVKSGMAAFQSGLSLAPVLARRWLAWLVVSLVLASGGCIVAPPPEHEEPQQTPPRLLLHQAEPPISKIVNIPIKGVPAVQEFAVPVQSEDAGDPLIGVLVASYGELNAATANVGTESSARRIDPANFDDPPRDMRVKWHYQHYDPGCYQLSLVVTHQANFDVETQRPREDLDDVALITWWVNLADGRLGSTVVASCPASPPWSSP